MSKSVSLIIDKENRSDGSRRIFLSCGCVIEGFPPIVNRMSMCPKHSAEFLENMENEIRFAIRHLVEIEFKGRIKKRLRKILRELQK